MGLCGSSVAPINPTQVDLSHFKLQRIVGTGGFGKVKACMKISECGGDKDQWYAMKIMSKKVAAKRKMTNEFFSERNMVAELQNDFICNGKYAWADDQYCYMVLDLALGGDIKYQMKHMGEGKPGRLNEELALFYFAQVS